MFTNFRAVLLINNSLTPSLCTASFFLALRLTIVSLNILEVSDYCDILRHHDCENYHDCHILQTFGTNKQAVVYKILSNTCHCTIPMVVESCSTHYKCYWNKEIHN